MTVLKWKEPSPIASRGARTAHSRYEAEANTLRMNRGKWAVIEEFSIESTPRSTPASLVNGIATGRYAAFRPVGSFEVTRRANFMLGVHEVYVRYIG